MARPEEFWSDLYTAFDPSEVLVGERAHNLYCEREHSPINEMGPVFRKSSRFARPPIAFFTGHRGSGKSSMLFRFLEQFQQDFFVIYFDIEHNLDSSKTNQLDLLYLLGASVYKAAENEGLLPDPKNLTELGNSLYTIAKKEEEKPAESVNYVELAKGVLVFTASVLGSKVGEKLAEALLKPFSITSGISEETARKREIEPDIQQVISNVNLIISDVQTKSGKSPLIVVDGLDKLQRPEQAKLIFLESRSLRGPICRLIYTVPMLIYTLPEFLETTQDCRSYCLPNVKLYHKRNMSISMRQFGTTIFRNTGRAGSATYSMSCN